MATATNIACFIVGGFVGMMAMCLITMGGDR